MKRIPLTQGKFALVDDEDYEWLMQWKWVAGKTRDSAFVTSRSEKRNGKWTTINMAREIMRAPKGLVVDHINHNRLDNRKCNLRICTYQQNQRNRQPNIKCKSKYKGVHWNVQVWIAQITVDYKRITIGRYKGEVDAAKAYDKTAKELFGEFAYLNFSEIE